MARAPLAFVRWLGQGLSFAMLRRPSSPIGLAGFGVFLLAWGLCTLAFLGIDALVTPRPRVFDASAVWVHAGFGLSLLLAAWLSARLLRRPATWLSLASLIAIAAVPWTMLSMAVAHSLEDAAPAYPWAPAAGATLVWIVMFGGLVHMHWALGEGVSLPRRAVATVLAGVVLVFAWSGRDDGWFWYPAEAAEEEYPDDVEPAPAPNAPPTSPAARARARAADPEVLLGRQPALVARAVGALAAQSPGRIDLYALGFAGDGTEPAFRNEVEYFGQLLPRRFGAEGRTLQLINHPGTTAGVPLATVANLRAALAGIGARMDRDEDVLVLFLTSHGSPDHWLAVDLPPLPLRQLRPADVRDALDDAGIRWRVVVVSACYSGGFIDALRDPRTLVITAARADRPSFGCGIDSEITWFGDAFLVDALNHTLDFRQAYAIAARDIRTRERQQGETPSVPQIWGGDLVDAQLAAWRAGVVDAPAVPFVPAVDVAHAAR